LCFNSVSCMWLWWVIIFGSKTVITKTWWYIYIYMFQCRWKHNGDLKTRQKHTSFMLQLLATKNSPCTFLFFFFFFFPSMTLWWTCFYYVQTLKPLFESKEIRALGSSISVYQFHDRGTQVTWNVGTGRAWYICQKWQN